MSYADESHLVVLDCGHSPVFRGIEPPRKGDVLLCVKCDRVQTVTDAPPEYRSQCTMCSFGVKTGRARETAIMGAIKHARKRSHIVRVYDGTLVINTVGTGERQLPLDLRPGAPPPF